MNRLRSLQTALAFLTILPSRPVPATEEDLARSLGYFPLVGMMIGVGLTAFASAVDSFLSAPVSALCLVSLLVVVTGGLHVDGWADLFDGLGSGRDPERALAIMRDSQIGALGATALILMLAIKAGALSDVLAQQKIWTVLSFPAFARWLAVMVVLAFPYARQEGLGKPFRLAGSRQLAVATVCMVPLVLALPQLWWVFVATALTILTFAYWVSRRLDGLTGDAYGAVVEFGETAMVLFASVGP